jgi:hypothetical protein
MKSAAKEKIRSSGPTRSYLKTCIRGSRLQNAARILALIELTRRVHQAYEQAYDKQAADRLLPQKTDPKRNCTFPTYDQLSATQQGLLNAGTYSGLSDAQRANFLNQTGALGKAGINLGDARLQDGGILTDRLLFRPGTTRDFQTSIVAAIGNGSFIKDTPLASKHPGMSDFGARQNRTFNALQAGFGPEGAFIDIDRGNPSGGLAGLIVHGAEVLTPGKTDPFAVGKKLGSKVTGYTCK